MSGTTYVDVRRYVQSNCTHDIHITLPLHACTYNESLGDIRMQVNINADTHTVRRTHACHTPIIYCTLLIHTSTYVLLYRLLP